MMSYPVPSRSGQVHALVRLDGVGQGSEALYLDGDLVPRLQPDLRVAGRADARGRACDNDVTGDEGHAPGEKGDELGDREDHLRGRPVLHYLAVQDAAYGEVLGIFDLVCGGDERTQGAEGVYGFAAGPLSALRELEVARGDVVGVHVAEDVVEGLGLRDVAGCPPYNDGELGLVVGLLGYRGYSDGLAWPYDRVRVHGKDDGLIGDIRPRLSSMVLVVEAYADQLMRPRYRSVDADVAERHRIFTGLRATAVLDELDHVLVTERPYLIALQRPDALLPTTHRIRYQSQGLSSPRIRDATIRILAATLVLILPYGCRRTILHPLPERW